MNKINEATFFFISSLKKKSDEGHLKQMWEGLRNNSFCLFGLIEKEVGLNFKAKG